MAKGKDMYNYKFKTMNNNNLPEYVSDIPTAK